MTDETISIPGLPDAGPLSGTDLVVVDQSNDIVPGNTKKATLSDLAQFIGPTGGSVTQVNTGTGLFGGPITGVGTVALADTTVSPGTYPNPIITVDQQGRITSAVGGGAGVTNVATGTGLTGGPITTTGTIALANTSVVPGSYPNLNATIDQQGRITAAASGPGSIGLPSFATVADAQRAVIPDTANNLQVFGYNSPADNGGGIYERDQFVQCWSGTGQSPQPLIPPNLISGGLPIPVYTTTISGPIISLRPIIAGSLAFIVVISRRADLLNYALNVTDSAGNAYVPAGTVVVSSGSYNSVSGLVTLNLANALPPTVNVGDNIYVRLTGTGSISSLTGAFSTTSISGATVTFHATTGLSLTIIGGSVVPCGGGSTVFDPIAFVFYCTNPVYAPAGTSFNGLSAYDLAYTVYSVPGFTGASPDKFAIQFVPSGGSGGVSLTSPTLTANDLAIGIVSRQNSPRDTSGDFSYTPPAGWNDISPTINGRSPISSIAAASAATVTYNPTWVGANPPTTTLIVTFQTFPLAAINPSFWTLDPAPPIHTAAYGIIPGVADDALLFQNFNRWIASIASPSWTSFGSTAGSVAASTVTMSIANPAVVTVTVPAFNVNPGFRNGLMVSFSTTGILPAPIVPNQIYYIQYGTVTYNNGTGVFTFQISNTSLFLRPDGTQTSAKGTSIATSGTQNGTHSCTTYGESWADLVLDPGIYYSSSNQAPGPGTGLRKWRLHGPEARFQTNVFFSCTPWGDVNANTSGTTTAFSAQFQTTTAQGGSIANSITLLTPALASNFYVNSWVVLMCGELQTSTSGNWNEATFEYARVQTVNTSTGVITFWDSLQYNYRSTLPKFAARAGDWSGAVCGPATIVQMNDCFDQEAEIHGVSIYGSQEENFLGLLSLKLVDCDIYGWGFKAGPFPSTMRKFTMENCRIHNSTSEVDKMIDRLQYIECTFDSTSPLLFQAAGINKFVLDRCTMLGGMRGTPRDTTIRDSFIAGQFIIGPVYGSTERILLENTTMNNVVAEQQQGEVLGLAGITVTNGTIVIPTGTTSVYGTWRGPSTASDCPVIWASSGAKIAICSSNVFTTGTALGMGVHCNLTVGMMTAFIVADVYTDDTNAFGAGVGSYCVDTTLTALPTSNITVTGTMSGTALTVTAISPAGACLLANMKIVATAGGTLPANTIIQVDLGVPNATSNLGVYTLSNAPASGAPTSFTASTPMNFLPHTCPRLTVLNCTGGRFVTDMAGAPPDIPIWSYFRRAFAGFPMQTFFPQAYIPLAGNLTSWTINVIKPYTGSAGTYTVTFYVFGWVNASGNYYPTFLKQVVNLKTAGVRTITAVGVSGNVAGDTIVAVPFWLTGEHLVVNGPTLGGGDTLANMPYYIMQGQTDQGIDFASMIVNTTKAGLDELSDTVTGMAIS